MVHILSATALNFDDGITRHLTFCNKPYVYGEHTDSYVIGAYASSRGATCSACLLAYVHAYPASVRSDVAILRTVGKQDQADFLADYLSPETCRCSVEHGFDSRCPNAGKPINLAEIHA